MKFGLVYEMQLPGPVEPGADRALYHDTLDQVQRADELGFDYVWAVEHHFLKDFAHCPAPEVLFGAISQRTKRIRIGHAVVLLPPQYNHPIRVAERAAVLDILSNGRMDLGTGRSSTLIEMEGFGVDPETTKPVWEEAVRIIPRMWTEETFEHHGEYFDIPPRSIVPKPVQQPHPPLWVGCSQPASFAGAGDKGLGALCFNIGAPNQLQERIDTYRTSVAECTNPVGSFVNNQVAGFTIMHCAPTDEDAVETAGEHAMYFMQKSLELYQPWLAPDTKVPDSYKFFASGQGTSRFEKSIEEFVADGTVCVGSPETCIENVKKYEAIGLDQVLCLMQFGKMKHEDIMRSIELVGEHVLPAFR